MVVILNCSLTYLKFKLGWNSPLTVRKRYPWFIFIPFFYMYALFMAFLPLVGPLCVCRGPLCMFPETISIALFPKWSLDRTEQYPIFPLLVAIPSISVFMAILAALFMNSHALSAYMVKQYFYQLSQIMKACRQNASSAQHAWYTLSQIYICLTNYSVQKCAFYEN